MNPYVIGIRWCNRNFHAACRELEMRPFKSHFERQYILWTNRIRCSGGARKVRKARKLAQCLFSILEVPLPVIAAQSRARYLIK